MAEQEQPVPKPDENQSFWKVWRAPLVGCLAFFVTLSVCLVATTVATHLATRNMGRAEVNDALNHAVVSLQWFCGGSFISLIVAAIIAYVAATEPFEESDDQRPRK